MFLLITNSDGTAAFIEDLKQIASDMDTHWKQSNPIRQNRELEMWFYLILSAVLQSQYLKCAEPTCCVICHQLYIKDSNLIHHQSQDSHLPNVCVFSSHLLPTKKNATNPTG